MIETTVDTRGPDRDDLELTQQFTPIFQSLLRRSLGRENEFHRDPLAAPLPAQLSASPSEILPSATGTPETVSPEAAALPPSTLDGALLSGLAITGGLLGDSADAVPASTRQLQAVPTAGGAHRAGAPAQTRSRAGRRADRAGAHRAPEAEPRHAAEQPTAGRGRHRTLRSVVH